MISTDDSGLPLGVEPDEAYREIEIALASGESLILLTDGITEARLPNSTAFFGMEGVVAAAPGALNGSLGKAGRDVYEAALKFAGGHLTDDACLLLARRN